MAKNRFEIHNSFTVTSMRMRTLTIFLSVLITTLFTTIPANAQSDRTFTYLALGDSYTIGETVDAKRRWPVQLANFLNIKGKKVSQPLIIAKTG